MESFCLARWMSFSSSSELDLDAAAVEGAGEGVFLRLVAAARDQFAAGENQDEEARDTERNDAEETGSLCRWDCW